MPTIISHPAPVLCLGLALGRNLVSPRLLLAGILFSILPDLDVIGFRFGIAYADALGHRGLTHSLLFVMGAGLLGALAAPLLKSRRLTAFCVLGGAVAAHILLDAMTNGGLGVALFWPFSDTRYFLPWRPIVVSPFSVKQLLSERGVRVFMSEWRWVWLPSMAGMVLIYLARRLGGRWTGKRE